jgi:hypothetical protein
MKPQCKCLTGPAQHDNVIGVSRDGQAGSIATFQGVSNEQMSAATPRTTYYSASGMVPPTAWIMVAVLLIPIAAIAGMLYSAGIVHIPMVKLRWVGSLGLGWAIGMLAAKVCYWGKVRSRLFAIVTVIVGFAVAYYCAWGIHRTLLVMGKLGVANPGVFVLQGFLPTEIASWMMRLIKNGNAERISGIALIFVWLVEFGAIAYFTKTAFLTVWDNRPFCEACDQWNEPAESLLHLPVSPDDPAWQNVRDGGLDSLKKLKMKENANETVAMTLSSCPNCDRSHYLTATGMGWQTNAAGEATLIESHIFQDMAVSARADKWAKRIRRIVGRSLSRIESRTGRLG